MEITNKYRKIYIKPEVEKIIIDRVISFIMVTTPPIDPEPKKKPIDDDDNNNNPADPFSSPFK
ncbi:MAG: hypothetical protein HY738_22075 [Bacteroidia bacterium]|nr:hypothetical protein [Bacteroidia bacterium]